MQQLTNFQQISFAPFTQLENPQDPDSNPDENEKRREGASSFPAERNINDEREREEKRGEEKGVKGGGEGGRIMEMQFATEAVNEQDFVREARRSSSVSARRGYLLIFRWERSRRGRLVEAARRRTRN